MTTADIHRGHPTLATLAVKEIVNYLKHPLFLVGAGLLGIATAMQADGGYSNTLDGLAAAAGLGLFGLVVMVSLTRRSDRAAEAAGTVSVDQRTRTLALACAVVVPLVCALIWFAVSVAHYRAHPPEPAAVPFGPVTDTYVLTVMFAQGVVASVGGPLLGLVLGRWLPHKGVAPVAVVLLVLVTILMQGLFEVTRPWREVWPWTHFFGPLGVDGDPDRAVVLTGSPYWYVAYLAGLCVVGVLVALLRDTEADRRGLLRALVVVAAVTAVLCVLSMTGGYDEMLVNPLSSGIV